MKPLHLATALIALTAAAGFAHDGVQNPVVMARMVNMSDMAEQMEVVVNMARGQTDFDAEIAQAAMAQLARDAAATHERFAEPATDPKSEALPTIWDNFADFTERAEATQASAEAAISAITSRETLIPAVQAIGATCGGCHDLYREE